MKRRIGKNDRIRHLIALDATNVMRRLTERAPEMVTLFSRLRDREPLLAPIRTWFDTVTFGELSVFDPPDQWVINAFYDALAELRWYLQYTEDMPNQVQRALTQRLASLDVAYRALIVALGPASSSGARVVEGAKRPSR